MKTCSSCGTLLFDDVEKCTKCGLVLVEKEGGESAKEDEAKTEPEAENAEAAAKPEAATEGEAEPAPEGAEESQEPAEEAGKDSGAGKTVIESAAKRKKWLDEQEKIKAELSNIMGRIGKKKPAAAPGSTGTSMTPPFTSVPPGTANVPAQATNPQIQPTPAGPVPQAQVQPQVGAGDDEAGLSEFDKKELLGELDDLRNEGYEVSRLERIIEENPKSAWKSFSEFLDDIEKLNQQKARVEKINTSGNEQFEAQKNALLQKMVDPDQITQYEGEITALENEFLAAKGGAGEVAAAGAPTAGGDAQLDELINAGKELVKVKNYEEAMNVFTQAKGIDPTHKEVQFFTKKLEAKLSGEPFEGPEEEAVAGVEAEGGKKKKKRKKKKLVSRRAATGEAAPGVAPAQVAAKLGPKPITPVTPVQPTAQGQPQQPVQPKQQPVQPVQPEAAGSPQEIDADEGPRSAAEFEALGFNAYINKDYPKALEFYEKVLEIDPNFPGVESIRNECLMRLGKVK
jgi:tetratricopeptide (TPR) repeat protein